MTDDHDRCEWVTNSSGSAVHPGCPEQSPEIRKQLCVTGMIMKHWLFIYKKFGSSGKSAVNMSAGKIWLAEN